MGVPFQVCEEALETAVENLFDSDPQIQAVGIGRHERAFGFKAVKNAAKILPASLAKRAKKPPKAIKKVPVTIVSVTADIKVGRTTGLTHGSITAVGVVTGPIPYDPGPCWFQGQFEIEGENGTLFSDHGDSGSAIVSTTGEVIGLLYAGNGTQTYACPIQAVLTALNCTLA
jgi:hypothetical protein